MSNILGGRVLPILTELMLMLSCMLVVSVFVTLVKIDCAANFVYSYQ